MPCPLLVRVFDPEGVSMVRPLFLLALVLILGLSTGVSAKEISVAVFEFKEAGLVDLSYYQKRDLLHGLSQMIASKLAAEPGIKVVERDRIEDILREQRFQQSRHVDESTAVEMGRLIGADVIIMGTLNEVSWKNGIGVSLGKIKVNTTTAKVRMYGRLIAVETGEILASVDARGENTGAAVSVRNLHGLSFGSEEFNDSIIGKALNAAIDDFVQQAAAGVYKIQGSGALSPTEKPYGCIVGTRGDYLIIDIGAQDGIRENMILRVYSVERVMGLREPVRIPLGTVKVISVDEHACVAMVEESLEPMGIGDLVQVQ